MPLILNLRDSSDEQLESIADRCARWLNDPKNHNNPRYKLIDIIHGEVIERLYDRARDAVVA